MTESRITLANDSTDIISVCRVIGMSVPDFAYVASMKLYCPFGEVSHADGGQSKAFRVYPETNSSYCFACGEAFSPVKLLATARDITPTEAADVLLEIAGVAEEKTDERWAQLIASQEPPVNTAELSEALKIFCARIEPRWEERQFESAIAHTFQQCLELLPRVRTQADAEQWLAATKRVMNTKLGVDRERETV